MESTTLHYKARVTIQSRRAGEEPLFQQILRAVSAHFIHSVGFEGMPDFERFCLGGHYISEDKSVKMGWASHRQDSLIQWGGRLRVRDPEYARRDWTVDIAIRQLDENSYKLYFAEHTCDHMVDCFMAPPPPESNFMPFLEFLLRDDDFECVDANYPIPATALELAANLGTFVKIVKDETRTLPVMLITCTDLLNPHRVECHTTGNMFVFFSKDKASLDNLRTMLPAKFSFGVDAVNIFTPGFPTTRVIPAAEVHRLGEEKLIEMYVQAYCRNLRREEFRDFMSYDDIVRLRHMERQSLTERVVENLRDTHASLRSKITEQQSQIDALEARLRAASDKLDRNLEEELHEYERVLSECMTRKDNRDRLLDAITDSLYDPTHRIAPLHSGDEAIEKLIFAIGLRLASSYFLVENKKSRTPA